MRGGRSNISLSANAGKKEGIAFYKVNDLLSEPIKGTFYGNELSKIIVDDDNSTYRVEKVLRRNRNEVLVKWMGWPDKFNSWILKSDVTKF